MPTRFPEESWGASIHSANKGNSGCAAAPCQAWGITTFDSSLLLEDKACSFVLISASLAATEVDSLFTSLLTMCVSSAKSLISPFSNWSISVYLVPCQGSASLRVTSSTEGFCPLAGLMVILGGRLCLTLWVTDKDVLVLAGKTFPRPSRARNRGVSGTNV